MSTCDPLERLPEDLRPLADGLSSHRIEVCLDLLDRRRSDVIFVAEATHRRHNVSAIMRSAEAFGVHEAHLVAPTFKASKGAAKGAERWMDIHMHAETGACVAALRERGFRIYVADFEEGALTPADLPVDAPLALLFGGELAGVSEEARALADGAICIPMRGVTQSLNVSVAAAILLREACEKARSSGRPAGITGADRHRFLKSFLLRERERTGADRALYTEA